MDGGNNFASPPARRRWYQTMPKWTIWFALVSFICSTAVVACIVIIIVDHYHYLIADSPGSSSSSITQPVATVTVTQSYPAPGTTAAAVVSDNLQEVDRRWLGMLPPSYRRPGASPPLPKSSPGCDSARQASSVTLQGRDAANDSILDARDEPNDPIASMIQERHAALHACDEAHAAIAAAEATVPFTPGELDAMHFGLRNGCEALLLGCECRECFVVVGFEINVAKVLDGGPPPGGGEGEEEGTELGARYEACRRTWAAMDAYLGALARSERVIATEDEVFHAKAGMERVCFWAYVKFARDAGVLPRRGGEVVPEEEDVEETRDEVEKAVLSASEGEKAASMRGERGQRGKRRLIVPETKGLTEEEIREAIIKASLASEEKGPGMGSIRGTKRGGNDHQDGPDFEELSDAMMTDDALKGIILHQEDGTEQSPNESVCRKLYSYFNGNGMDVSCCGTVLRLVKQCLARGFEGLDEMRFHMLPKWEADCDWSWAKMTPAATIAEKLGYPQYC